jgi:hypothetical protein
MKGAQGAGRIKWGPETRELEEQKGIRPGFLRSRVKVALGTVKLVETKLFCSISNLLNRGGGNFLSKGSFHLVRGRESCRGVRGWEEHKICRDSMSVRGKI